MPTPDKMELLDALEKGETVSAGKWWRRLWRAPLSYFIWAGSRSFLKPFFSNGIDTSARTFFGKKMSVRLPAAADIYITGCKGKPQDTRLARWMINHIQPAWQVMDIGAHFGYYSLLLEQLAGPGGTVISFEPAPLAYRILAVNAAAYPAIQPYNAGLGSATGRQLLSVHGLQDSESNKFAGLAGAKTILADIITLDDWIIAHRIIPRFIKATVEGSEWNLIKGAASTIFLYHPVFAIEIQTTHFEQACYPAIEWLKANGYRMYSLSEDGELLHCADAWSYLQSRNVKMDYFLFMPREKIKH
ncbi:MAG: FkbM family methyltransferase [Chitinophagaceae bacterium]